MGDGVLELFETFFEPSVGGGPQPGDLYWVPTPECNEVSRILDVGRSDPTEHQAVAFNIVEYDSQNHYRSRGRLPIHGMNLGDTEELLIAKSKRRLCVVLGTAVVDTDDLSSLKNREQRIAGHLTRNTYLVAPAFGVGTVQDPNAFLPVLVDRINRLKYAHLSCIPDRGSSAPFTARSVIRLDHTFPSMLGRGTEAAELRIADEPFAVMQAQFDVLTGGEASAELRELIDLFDE